MTIKLGDPAGQKQTDVLNMLKKICPEANLSVGKDGKVSAGNADACAEGAKPAHAKGCECICALLKHTKTVTITVQDDMTNEGGGGTNPANAKDIDKTVDGTGTDTIVGIENQNRWRAQDPANGNWVDVPDWAILAHEICGHARAMMNGKHPEARPDKPGYKVTWHDAAIAAGDDIANENGIPKLGNAQPWIKPKKCNTAFQPLEGVDVTSATSSDTDVMTVTKTTKANIGGFNWHCLKKGKAKITVKFKVKGETNERTLSWDIECPD